MDNIITYLRWRGDLTFGSNPFSEVDNLVLSEFVYINLKEVVLGIEENKSISIEDVWMQKERIPFRNEQKKLLEAMAVSRRYQKSRLQNYQEFFETEGEGVQFAAVEICLPDGTSYIAFRGTDLSIVGWKEDFSMGYKIVPAQKKAVVYLDQVIKADCFYRLGGHSKGGNLAVYGAMMCESTKKEQIIEIYSNDGPGLSQDLLDVEKYNAIQNKIIKIVPAFSIFGQIFENRETMKVHAKKVHMGDQIDLRAISRMTSGASGADLANMINEAALRAVREGREYVIQEDLEESVETVLAGSKKKNKILSEKEKMMVSYHEIGHAMVAALQTHSAPVTKITIIPRTSGALGYTMQVDEEEHHLMSRTELENKIATLAGGRAAEIAVFGEMTSGAVNDIEQATKLAKAMISRYGMSDEIGMVAFERIENAYLGGDAALQCSEAIAEEIDRSVIALMKKQEDRAKQILTENMGKLHKLAQYLFENETISGETFMELLNAE